MSSTRFSGCIILLGIACWILFVWVQYAQSSDEVRVETVYAWTLEEERTLVPLNLPGSNWLEGNGDIFFDPEAGIITVEYERSLALAVSYGGTLPGVVLVILFVFGGSVRRDKRNREQISKMTRKHTCPL